MNFSKENLNAKDRIALAIAELIQERDISEITVSIVLKQANVSRSTFYRYFTDIYNVYEASVSELIEKCAKIFKDIFITRELSADDIELSVTDNSFFPEIFSFNETDIAMFRYLQTNNLSLFSELIKEKLSDDLSNCPDFVSSFLLDSLITIYTLDYFNGKIFNVMPIELASEIIKSRSLM